LRTSGFARAFATALLLFAFAAPAAHAEDAGTLLLPGIDIRTIQFTVGAWCRYRVLDEAMGEADSSEVRLAIVGREKTSNGHAYWLEIQNGPVGGGSAEREVSLALVDEKVRSMAPGDSLYRYVHQFYIRKGQGPVTPGDPRDLKRLTIVSPPSQSGWQTETGRQLVTPAGEFTCDVRRFEKKESRDIPSGRVTIQQRRSDQVVVWMSTEVPIFHLVKCEIERSRESRTVPPVRGIPESGPRRSRTVSRLVAHGTDARPSFSIP